jgi:alpha-beta hydrolase superfamily lysophospholipase
MMRQVDFMTDVTAAVGIGEHLMTAATVYLPDTISSDVSVIAAFPGGGYNRSYFNLVIDGNDSYSQALHHTSRGLVVVAIDHLDSGGSSSPSDRLGITFEHMAAANDATVSEARHLLESGTLRSDLGSVKIGPLIGIGHSMGASFLTVTQGIHKTFDAVALLGNSGFQPSWPDPSGKGRVEGLVFPPRGTDMHTINPVPGHTLEQILYCFHYEDVPSVIREADAAGRKSGSDQPAPSWHSATSPPCSVTLMSPGAMSPEAAMIDVPILIAVGERDLTADPHAEPTAYPASSDITLTIFPRMAHVHNFAGTRAQLWDRLCAWADGIKARHHDGIRTLSA